MDKRRKRTRSEKPKCKMIEITIATKCDKMIETRFGSTTFLEYLTKYRHSLIQSGRKAIIVKKEDKCILMVNDITEECLL